MLQIITSALVSFFQWDDLKRQINKHLSKTVFVFFVFGLVACDDLSKSGTGTGTGIDADAAELVVSQIGSGIGESFNGGVATATETSLDAGESSTITVNLVDSDNNLVIGGAALDVSFSSTCTALGLASFSQALVNTDTSQAETVYTAQGCSGDDTITAELTSINATATVTVTVAPNEVISVSFIEATSLQISLAGGLSGNETTEVTFQVSGPQNVPVIGETISFVVNTNAGGAGIISGRETDITDNDGRVSTILQSGTVSGNVNVVASHDATGTQGISADISISTGVPVASRFTLGSTTHNPSGAWDTNGVEVGFSIIASDQFGHNPPDGTRVTFVAPESGNIESSCSLVAGECSVTWQSTAPRPNDLRVQVMAYVSGAEDFVDVNGNGVFDGSGDTFVDRGEPYADQNENGAYDLGEFFFDTNGNTQRDGGNGFWDGPCLVSVDASALCLGDDTLTIASTGTLVLSKDDTARIIDLGNFPSPGTTISVRNGMSVSASGIVIADSNTNADSLGSNPMPEGTIIAFTTTGSGVSIGSNPSTWTIDGSPIFATGFYGMTVEAAEVESGDPFPTNVTLRLTVTPPDGLATEFTWPLEVTF